MLSLVLKTLNLLLLERADSDSWAVMAGGGNHNSTNVDLELEFSKYVFNYL